MGKDGKNIDSRNVATYIFSGEYYYDNLPCGKRVIFRWLSLPSIPAAAPVESLVGWGPLPIPNLTQGRDNGINGQRRDGSARWQRTARA